MRARRLWGLVVLGLRCSLPRSKPKGSRIGSSIVMPASATTPVILPRSTVRATIPRPIRNASRGGGRACLMVRAVAAAKAGDCDKALKLTLICQCHDGTAQEHLKAAGPRPVCGYLMSK